MLDEFDLKKPLETAKDVSFVLLSNLLVVFVILILLISVIYYATTGRKKDNDTNYMDYLKNQFKFDFAFPKKSSSSTDNNKSGSFGFPTNYMNFSFDSVKLNFFKYPALLFVSTIIFAILFSLPKKHAFNDTAKYSIPALGIFYLFVLYKSMTTSYLDLNNYNLNRIKSVIIFFSVIATLLTFYLKDPGNFIKNNFGESLLLIIVIGILIFAQLLNAMIVNRINPIQNYQAKRIFEKEQGNKKILKMLSYFSYFAFIIMMTFLMGSKYKDTKQYKPMLISTIIIGILWGAVNIGLFYTNPIRGSDVVKGDKLSKYFGIFIGIAILILGIITSLKLIDNFADNLTTLGKTITILILLSLMAVLYKFIKSKYRVSETKVDNIFNLILEGIFYIPCLLNDIFDFIYRLFYYLFTDEGNFSFYNAKDKISMLIILFIALFTLTYVSIKKINNKLVTQDGSVLINHPIQLTQEYHLGNYKTLNESIDYKYNFAISFWVYLHSNPSNNADKYYSILNYANKPNFLYNPGQNDFKIVCDMSGSDIQEVIYKNNDMKLQKWNNIVLNCENGNMDIFIDNNLVISKSGIIPLIDIDSLTVGENRGINGGICNVTYFKKPLSVGNMFILYHSIKYKNPPVTDISMETVIESI